jgi:hypothetical protein
MKPSEGLAAAMLILSAWGAASGPAGAETKLSDFDGQWQGSGKDRDLPFEAMQQTSCRTTVNADLVRLSSTTICNGDAGLDKIIQLAIILSGEAFSGNLMQKTTMRGDDKSVSVLNGSVSGRKTDKHRDLPSQFSGLSPQRGGYIEAYQSNVLFHAGNHSGQHLDGRDLHAGGQTLRPEQS